MKSNRSSDLYPVSSSRTLCSKIYRLNREVLAIANVKGKQTAITVPEGAILHIPLGEKNQMRICGGRNRTVVVHWDGEPLRMFQIDLEERGEELSVPSEP